jgi:hypothetical protein
VQFSRVRIAPQRGAKAVSPLMPAPVPLSAEQGASPDSSANFGKEVAVQQRVSGVRSTNSHRTKGNCGCLN